MSINWSHFLHLSNPLTLHLWPLIFVPLKTTQPHYIPPVEIQLDGNLHVGHMWCNEMFSATAEANPIKGGYVTPSRALTQTHALMQIPSQQMIHVSLNQNNNWRPGLMVLCSRAGSWELLSFHLTQLKRKSYPQMRSWINVLFMLRSKRQRVIVMYYERSKNSRLANWLAT